MNTLQPGQTQYGTPCQHCVKSMKKYNTYCSIASHHKTREVKQFKHTTEKSSHLDKLKNITKLTQDYSYQSLITAVMLMFPQINNVSGVIQLSSKLKTNQLNSYLVNLHLADSFKIQKYIEYIGQIVTHFPNIQESKLVKKDVFSRRLINVDLVVRNQQNQQFSFINRNNYFLYQSKLSRWIPLSPELQQIKKEFLEYYGFYSHSTLDKIRNKEIKETFSYRPGKIPYFERLIEEIRTHNQSFTRFLVNELTFPDTEHPVYLLDGKTIKQLNSGETKTGNPNWNLQQDMEYLGKATLRYYLSLNGVRKFKVDIGFNNKYFEEPLITIMTVS